MVQAASSLAAWLASVSLHAANDRRSTRRAVLHIELGQDGKEDKPGTHDTTEGQCSELADRVPLKWQDGLERQIGKVGL